MTVTATTSIDGKFPELQGKSIEELTINTVRTLSMDAIQKANSGHPGTPMALAPLAYVLYQKVLSHNPANPHWVDRDRFVLSIGHASMLLYSMLHLTGYDLSLQDIIDFRQLGSKTPGHPEYGHTVGVETTTGPLGQGIANAVGMALAEAHLAARYNRPGHAIVDHYTYSFAGDGDLMEGVSHEAASLAGHLGLGKLVVVYDDNKITIDGGTDLSFSEDVAMRFQSYGWHVNDLGDSANDLDAMEKAINEAKAEESRPSLILLRSHIGYGAPNKQDTSSAHGSPLGEDEIRAAKQFYGWPQDEKFLVPSSVVEHMSALTTGRQREEAWNESFAAYAEDHPELAAEFNRAMAGELVDGWDADLATFDGGSIATRAASGKVLNSFAANVTRLVGGSADLTGSTKTWINGSGTISREDYSGQNMYWGIREHGMAGVCNGMAVHGGVTPYCATFLVFTDYCKPSIRLAAMMEQQVVYVMTHDSIGLGEDGPTHQPIEHLSALRAIPNLRTIRPADGNETGQAWKAALEHTGGPTVLVLSRQGLPNLDQQALGSAQGLLRGGYILSEASGDPTVILIATGSEVALALDSQAALEASGVATRVVSLPCWELFRAQGDDYRESVLPSAVSARVAIEAAGTQGWLEWVGGQGAVIGMTGFGASAPANQLFEKFGFTVERVVETVNSLLD